MPTLKKNQIKKTEKSKALRPTCGEAQDLGQIEIRASRKGEIDFGASCNFCRIRGESVHVITGGQLVVRICEGCLSKISQYQEDL